MAETELLIWEDPLSGIRTFQRTDAPALVRFEAIDGLSVSVNLHDLAPIVDNPEVSDPSEIQHLLESYVDPRIAAHDGALVLHGSSVVLDARAVLFIGQTGRGKSTLMSSFWSIEGARVGDDSLICDVHEAPPTIRAIGRSCRLLPDSLSALAAPRSSAPIGVDGDKRRLEIDAAQLMADPTPLAAVFSLDEDCGGAAIEARALSSGDACMEIIANSFALDPRAPIPARKRMNAAAALVAAVPCFALSYPRDYARLPEVQAAILAAAGMEGLSLHHGSAMSGESAEG
ncbi:hypothetical protein [Cognatishimia sp. F0-27]|uniref:hypothetical protein n=1 Tax=Cognatishimia sp. F0-27 TaxID=2816855 RepID=UPI001D0C3280|nr:hypothetical protein [Cognatishimia sp. F0-27]MCC1493809.1 hypothetical protein [Cognatishimia sp. F0-27]